MYELNLRIPLLITFLIIVLVSFLIWLYFVIRNNKKLKVVILKFKNEHPKSLTFSQVHCDVQVKLPTILSAYYCGKRSTCDIHLNENQILVCPYKDSLVGKYYSPPYILGKKPNTPLIPAYYVNKIEKVDEFLRLSFEREHNTKVQLDLALTDEQYKELKTVLQGKET